MTPCFNKFYVKLHSDKLYMTLPCLVLLKLYLCLRKLEKIGIDINYIYAYMKNNWSLFK